MFVDLVYSLRLDAVPLNGAHQDGGIPYILFVFLNGDLQLGYCWWKKSGKAIDMENLQSLLLLLQFDNTDNKAMKRKKDCLGYFWGDEILPSYVRIISNYKDPY